MKPKEKMLKMVLTAVSKLAGGLSQDENAGIGIDAELSPDMPGLLRQAAAEGAVLLKNDVLPFQKGSRVSIFGRVQQDYFFTGYGSGGNVNAHYKINLMEGIKACESLKINEGLAGIYEAWCQENPVDHGVWGMWPRCYPEMPVSNELAMQAAANSDCAVIVIGRSSGEDRENALEGGSYYLTEDEKNLIQTVCSHFNKTALVLNIGSVMDFSWIAQQKNIGAVLIAWQGGMESGNAVADLLSGAATPCGRLTDTIAKNYDSYPSSSNFGNKEFNFYHEDIYVGYRWFETFQKDDVLYPFGYGLSYTSFKHDVLSVEENAGKYKVLVQVTNTGNFSGKDVVCLYLKKPCGKLGNPSRVLVDYVKTGLLSTGESEQLCLTLSQEQMASYDSSGKTGFPYCEVIEPGDYRLFLGGDVRCAKYIHTIQQEKTIVHCKLSQAAAPKEPFPVIMAVEEPVGQRKAVTVPAPIAKTNLRQRILHDMPKSVTVTGDKGICLRDVQQGQAGLDDFVAQLSLEELEAISRGAYKMNSPLGPVGNAGVFGGVLPSLRDKGVPPVVTTDGPSGIRLSCKCSLLPIGTLLACTFNRILVQQIYEAVGSEMRARGSDVLLAPGMNIHRNPLCGRNFEYFSEDPYISGTMAAAAVKGLQLKGVSACPKHFACNNQEYKRNRNDSRVSERALREIYLKGFEICVKTAQPKNIMTSYNKINGVWGHYHYELCTTILRDEWGYQGNVMTDWWMRRSKSPEFPALKDNAYRVRAQVDLLMPGGKQIGKPKPDGTLLKTYGKPNGITLGEMQRSAANILRMALWLMDEREEKENGNETI